MAKGKKLLVNGSALARMAGVSRPAVSQAKSKFPEEAFVGAKIDLNHPAVQEWLRSRDRNQPAPQVSAKKPPQKAPSPPGKKSFSRPKPQRPAPPVDGDDLPDDEDEDFDALSNLEELASAAGIMTTEEVESIPNMTLNQIYQKFGTQEAFKDLMTARKLIPEIRLKDIQANEKRGEFIPRAMVSKHIIPLIDNTNKRLVGDLPPTLTAKIMKLALSGEDAATITEKVRIDISKILKDVKADVVRMITNA
jgi:hypothetical protein